MHTPAGAKSSGQEKPGKRQLGAIARSGGGHDTIPCLNSGPIASTEAAICERPARTWTMKEGIHPNYFETVVTCGCGNTFKTRSTRKELKVDICNQCHPFFTGRLKYVDTAGRIEKFQSKFAAGSYASLQQPRKAKKSVSDSRVLVPSRTARFKAVLSHQRSRHSVTGSLRGLAHGTLRWLMYDDPRNA